ncbi:MAG: RidA family protein [Betaproteobacteria bacterium]|nr:MAG: RidA family protein [Betaproteobacteria bacterium]
MPRSVVATDALMQPIAQFSFGLRAGDLIYIGATAGTDAARRLSGSTPGLVDTGAQARRMFSNLDLSLKLLGGRLEDVVRLKSYLADWRDLPGYRKATAEYLQSRVWCRSTLGTPGFPLPQAAVEAEMLAVVGRKPGPPVPFVNGDAPLLSPASSVMAGEQHYCTAYPIDSGGNVAAGDIALQAELALRNLAQTLQASGLSLSEIVMLNVTLSDIRLHQDFDKMFQRCFDAPYPARSIQTASLEHPAMLLQIESTAIKGGGRPVMGRGQPQSLATASPGMLAGDCLHMSGQIGMLPDDTFASGVQAQTEAAWARIHAILDEAGMQPDDVIHTTNYLTDWRHYADFNAGFATGVSPPYPPRATVLAGLVDPRALIQIEALANRNGRNAAVIGFRSR